MISPNEANELPQRLKTFLDNNYHGTMEWLEERSEWRSNPKALWPECRSIIMLAMNYGPDHDPLLQLEEPNHGTISAYAQNRDYHDIIKGKLKQIAGRFAAKSSADVKVFVDTAPVMEKPLAERAGIGWQGKHTNLVSRDFGSWLFLGAIFTTLNLPVDPGEIDHCGSCRACLDICPTDAFPAPYQLDARRCISYLTIEHKGPIDVQFRSKMGNRIYGCDDCLAICPWNKFASQTREIKLQSRDDLKNPELSYLASLDDQTFRRFFSKSPIKRIGRDKFVSNVLIAMGNSSNRAFIGELEPHLDDSAELVRAMAVWALRQLCTSEEFITYRQQKIELENSPMVVAEWN